MFLVRTFQLFHVLVAAAVMSSCQHDISKQNSASDFSLEIQATTKITGPIGAHQFSNATLRIPSELLDLRQVKRPRAELRMAPMSAYKIQDKLLMQNDRVAVFDQRGVWVKIVALDSDATGWVHHNALENYKNDGAVFMMETRLPRVFALRPLERAIDYQSGKAVAVNVKKGTALVSLRKTDGKVLVIIPENKTVAWFSQTDVQ